ncbi:unnamed protein product [Caenorhabditis auriculariae]|uniref:Nucleoporin NUP35 n=1 Tax=Caenorhabditis auriculariae TaxID=2777116 RepID=A0A8S1HY12_9PELO|nr:unnamed protein product [Caenorhabditis auriculariae]
MFSTPNSGRTSTLDRSELGANGVPRIPGTTQEQSTPSFLFGPKRRSTIVGNSNYANSPFSPSAPASDIFASPAPSAIPSHLKDSSAPNNMNKSVHWSPALVQQHDDRNFNATGTVGTPTGGLSSKANMFASPIINAPPLRSHRDELEPVKKAPRRSIATPYRMNTPASATVHETPEAFEGADDSAATWVTLFGFSSQQLSAVLRLFSRHGEIVNHQTPPKGNWMHVRYSCVAHAQQALARNGAPLDSATYIGAIPCTDKEVLSGKAQGIVARTPVATNRSLLNETIPEQHDEFIPAVTPVRNISPNENIDRSALNTSVFDPNASLNASRMSVRSGVGMRSLCAEQKLNATPQQSGILDKLWNTMEDPFAVALSKEQLLQYCSRCLHRDRPLSVCGDCRAVAYCSKPCQLEDALQHSNECDSIQKAGYVANDSVRLLMRIYDLWKAGQIGKVKVEGETRSLETLPLHDGEFEAEAQEFLLSEYLPFGRQTQPDQVQIKKIYKMLMTNSVTVSNQLGTSIGIALCIALSKADHSCKPNTRVAFHCRSAMLVPTDRMPTALSEATHSYIDELQPVSVRRKFLKERYHFDCECEGCVDVERNHLQEAWRCGICVDGYMWNTRDSKCSLCGWKIKEDYYAKCAKADEMAAKNLSVVSRDDLPLNDRFILAQRLMITFEELFYKYNVNRIIPLRTLYAASICNKDTSSAIRFGLDLLQIQQQYQEENDMAILYLKFGVAKVMLAGGAIESARELLEAIVGPYTRVFGPEAPPVISIRDMLKQTSNSEDEDEDEDEDEEEEEDEGTTTEEAQDEGQESETEHEDNVAPKGSV